MPPKVNVANPDFSYDASDLDGFRAGMFRIGRELGAKELGATVYELPQGQAVCPYHYEYGEEEWLLVLEGRPTLRHPGGVEALEPWDVVCFPRGPEGAHGIRNERAETARVLMLSTIRLPTVTIYPDSDKVGVWTGNPEDDLVAPRAAGVGYYDGEGSGG